jgi:hypothetical protein
MLQQPFEKFLDKTSVRLLTLRREAAYLVKTSRFRELFFRIQTFRELRANPQFGVT